MTQPNILWIDDEIDLLKPHLLFLQEKAAAKVPQPSFVDTAQWEANRPDAQQAYTKGRLLCFNLPGRQAVLWSALTKGQAHSI